MGDDYSNSSYNLEQCQSVCATSFRCRIGIEHTFSLFRTLGKTTFVTPNYLPDSEAVAVYSPIHTPTDSVAFRPMNVVVIIWEGFSKQHVGSLNPQLENGTYKGYTPFIDSLLTRSLTFQYSYSNGRKSIDGMPSVLSSIPSFVEPFFLTPSALNDVSSIAGELTKIRDIRLLSSMVP